MRRIVLAVSALALISACNKKPAETTQTAAVTAAETPEVNTAGTQPGSGASAVLADFVPRAAASDMYEVQAGKLAEAKGASADVRAFGKMMQTDHAKSTADLKSALAAAKSMVAPPAALPAEKQAMIDALTAAAPADFDRTYLDQQEQAHQDALALMKTYGDNGDVAEVKAFAAKTAPVVQAHLDKVKALKAAMK